MPNVQNQSHRDSCCCSEESFPLQRGPSSKYCLLSQHGVCYQAHFIFIVSLILLSLLYNSELHCTSVDYLRRDFNLCHSTSSAGVQRCDPCCNPRPFVRARNGQPFRLCLRISFPLVFKTGGPYDREIIPQRMFYRSLVDSLLYLYFLLPLS